MFSQSALPLHVTAVLARRCVVLRVSEMHALKHRAQKLVTSSKRMLLLGPCIQVQLCSSGQQGDSWVLLPACSQVQPATAWMTAPPGGGFVSRCKHLLLFLKETLCCPSSLWRHQQGWGLRQLSYESRAPLQTGSSTSCWVAGVTWWHPCLEKFFNSVWGWRM